MPAKRTNRPFKTNGDYRQVDGIKIPFRIFNQDSSAGEIVTLIKEVRHNTEIPEKVFHLAKQ
jgi:hypothetical protein